MKILKTENKVGLYSVNGSTWKPIDEIEKEDLMKLLDLTLTADVEMDPYSADTVGNPAHQIIYKSISEKLKTTAENKNQFKDQSDRLFWEQFEAYKE
jgi:hypothetical protein